MIDFKHSDELLNNYVTHGGFIVSGDRPNVMTASWGFFGVMWARKVVIVPVRNTRYTDGLIDNTKEFTLCVPYGKDMAAELRYCGSKSGRDVDKVKQLGLKLKKANKVDTYVIEGCQKYFECKVLCCLPLTEQNCPDFINKEFYKLKDYHNLYIAEVADEY